MVEMAAKTAGGGRRWGGSKAGQLVSQVKATIEGTVVCSRATVLPLADVSIVKGPQVSNVKQRAARGFSLDPSGLAALQTTGRVPFLPIDLGFYWLRLLCMCVFVCVFFVLIFPSVTMQYMRVRGTCLLLHV